MGKRFIVSDTPKISNSYQKIGDYRYMPYTYKSSPKPRVTKKMILKARAKERTIAVKERARPISADLQAWIDKHMTVVHYTT